MYEKGNEWKNRNRNEWGIVEDVESFKYLGATIASNERVELDVSNQVNVEYKLLGGIRKIKKVIVSIVNYNRNW